MTGAGGQGQARTGSAVPARSTGTRSGLFVSACGTPLNHTGLSFPFFDEERSADEDEGVMGMMLGGSARLGKWEMSGVFGGGRTRPNSDARE